VSLLSELLEPTTAPPQPAPLAAHVARLKQRLLTADYEICLARARFFTEVYQQTEDRDPAMRNALALERTLQRQAIFIHPDERLAGSKTERFLSTPLPVERGDFLRVLQLELDVLERKKRPFVISADDRACFWQQILPYWDGRTVHDEKARHWLAEGVTAPRPGPIERARGWGETRRWLRYLGRDRLTTLLGAAATAPLTWHRLRNLWPLWDELSRSNPTPAVYCLDVQGHLCLGIGEVVQHGMQLLVDRAETRCAELNGDPKRTAFLKAMVISLQAAMAYADRFAELAGQRAAAATEPQERERLERIARHCRHVPRHPARSFHEALQSAWLTQVVAEIQFGTMDVFAVGRIDQFLFPLYQADLAAGTLSQAEAMALLQEYFLKLSANVAPVPEMGMESNAVLGNSQHCVTIGGLTPSGQSAENELSELILAAYEQLGGTVNQLCVRLHESSTNSFVQRACSVFRHSSGIAFYNDEAIVEGLLADGMTAEDARDYCIVGCVETCGHGNMQGCVAGHDLVLPAVLLLSLSNGTLPPRSPGQQLPYRSGDPSLQTSFSNVMCAFERQLDHQVQTMVKAVAGKDIAHRDMLPAPYISALVDGCIDSAVDITGGGARYDFTSIDVRGLATLVDALLAIEWLVFEQREMSLPELMAIVAEEFRGHEPLRQRLCRLPPKYGHGDCRADELTAQIVALLHRLVAAKRNVRGGRYRVAYFSLGNHVIDGLMLGATPDGRLGGTPISNGVSPSDRIEPPHGPHTVMRSVAKLPPAQVSSGIALNMRFHPRFLAHDSGLAAFASLIQTYFAQGGMHLQPNVVSIETLRDAQRHPERYRDLVVKVSGYSACFTDLGRSIQEDIISRTAFGAPQ